MSVLIKEKEFVSIHCFVKNKGKPFEMVRESKRAVHTLLAFFRELLRRVFVVPLLRYISWERLSSMEAKPFGDKNVQYFTRISSRKGRNRCHKEILAVRHSALVGKVYRKEAFWELFQFTPCPMLLISLDNGKLLAANEDFLKLTGQEYATVLKWDVRILGRMISPRDYYRLETKLLQQEEVKDYQCRIQVGAKRGTIVVNMKCIMLEGQNMLMVTVVDVTEMIELKQHMERLSCLNLVGQLAASIGHEIRNPMTTVRGYLRYMQRKPSFSGFNDRFSMMISELDRANEMITDFLDLAKNRMNGVAVQNVNTLIEAIAPLMEAMASETGHSIEFQLQPIPDLVVDKIDIHKVLINLVKNAFEAMDTKGKVVVSTFWEAHFIVVQVADEGKGIAPEVLEKVGTPFFTTKEKGTGLGLSVCYQIAERHKALIDIKTSNRGSIFSLKFPYNKKDLIQTEL